jgi:hypothetical protein
MAEDSGATGSPHPPNDTPNENDANLGISEHVHTDQQLSSLRKLGSDSSTGRALIRSNSTVSPMGTGARRRNQFRRVLKKVAWGHHEDEAGSSTSPRRGLKWRNQMDIEASQTTSVHGRLMVHSIRNDDVELGCPKFTQYSLTAPSVRRVVSIIIVCVCVCMYVRPLVI